VTSPWTRSLHKQPENTSGECLWDHRGCLAAPCTVQFSSLTCCPGFSDWQAAGRLLSQAVTPMRNEQIADHAVLTAALMAACHKVVWT